jgi:GH25 family lysozyme M1 (1,4-beta-N-acetylmuramidase)
VTSGDADFVYIKATEGVGYTDPDAVTNGSNANTAGIDYGYYHFATPSITGGNSDAVAEADAFVTFLNNDTNATLPPVLDLEKRTELTDAELATWVVDFMTRVNSETGDDPILYTYLSYIKEYFSDADSHTLDDYPLWLAQYTDAEEATDVAQYGMQDWTIWQYTSRGSIDGISGRVDFNRAQQRPW